ncbi:MAG: hypothetical protein HZC47_08660 [Methanobacterium sp.]|uniref:hypothetical protein n=1 Tax=Methanobacterium sp. TaxID=2164 RepID=UPI003D649FCF|nr:hypothetical protein [Methanobacterium sp.]
MAEIKSIKIVPFTLMSSSISAILALIGAIILTLALGVIAAVLPPQFAPLASLLAGFGLAAIIAYPILTFLIGLSTVFLSILLYNLLAPKVGGVQLTMDGNNVESIPIVPFALILSIIMAIWTFIMGLLLTTILAPVTGLIISVIPLATNGTATGAGVGSLVTLGAIFFIIVLPILVLIFGFIGHALFAAFYNFIAAKASKIQLNFEALPENWHKLTEIPIIPAALALAVVSAIFGLIMGILDFASGYGIMAFLIDFIGNFIYTFIIVAIGAGLYNFLAPKIGAVQLELE